MSLTLKDHYLIVLMHKQALSWTFSIDNGLLTQTLKQKRDRIADRDTQAIEAIYGR